MSSERPNRNVYILGAGFLAPSGAPVIRNFLDRSREFYDDPKSSMNEEERKRFATVFKFKRLMGQSREKFAIDLDDIEKLFGLVEISERLGENLGDTREDMVYLIAKTLQLATSSTRVARPKVSFDASPNLDFLRRVGILRSIFQDQGGNRFRIDMYDYFAAVISGALDHPGQRSSRKDTIITFNYDLICDDALRRLGVRPNYHLKPLVTKPPSDNEGVEVDLLKLHGSANWGICTKCREEIVVLPEKVTVDPDGLRSQVCPKCETNTYELLLIPPSWDKSEYKDVVKRVWTKALEELSLATRICIVGYSMPEADAFFQYLLTLALSKNEALYKLIVVDQKKPTLPAPSGVYLITDLETRYRKMLDPMFQERRFSFYNTGIQGFLGSDHAVLELGRGEVVQGNVSCV